MSARRDVVLDLRLREEATKLREDAIRKVTDLHGKVHVNEWDCAMSNIMSSEDRKYIVDALNQIIERMDSLRNEIFDELS